MAVTPAALPQAKFRSIVVAIGLFVAVNAAILAFGYLTAADVDPVVRSLADGPRQAVATAFANFHAAHIAALAIAAFNMLFLMIFVLRQLRRHSDQLTRAKTETDDILGTIKEGLFLLSPDFSIGYQHSQALKRILNRDDLASVDLIALLGRMVPEKTLTTVKDYVTLLFGDRVNEKLVADLNPLDAVEVFQDSGDGRYQTKYLSFTFKRIINDKHVSHLLVQVYDISDQVKLRRELEQSQAQSQAQFDMLLKVLHVKPPVLLHFLDKTRIALDTVNKLLEQRGNALRPADKLEPIGRAIHAVKGDAAALDLESFEDKAHQFEDVLDALRKKPNLGGGDFLGLALKLEDLLSHVEATRELIERITALQDAFSDGDAAAAGDDDAALAGAQDGIDVAAIDRLAERVAGDHGKQVTVQISGMHRLGDALRATVNDVLIQLVRNSVVHGIETPQQRRDAGKPALGTIRAELSLDPDGGYQLLYRDDGAGLSEQRLRAAAVRRGLYSAEEVAALPVRTLYALIFRPGFSSIENAGKDAGRGTGMDLVANAIRDAGGRLQMKSAPGRFCEFRIALPDAVGARRVA